MNLVLYDHQFTPLIVLDMDPTWLDSLRTQYPIFFFPVLPDWPQLLAVEEEESVLPFADLRKVAIELRFVAWNGRRYPHLMACNQADTDLLRELLRSGRPPWLWFPGVRPPMDGHGVSKETL